MFLALFFIAGCFSTTHTVTFNSEGGSYISPVIVKNGKTIINTGNNFFKDVSINHHKKNKDYYIYTNNDEILIYKGREGEYVWNLLEK